MAWAAPKIDWTSAPGVTDIDLNRIEGNILYIKTDHMDLTTGVHGAVSAATASAIVARDAAARTKMAAPAAADDVAILQTVTDEGTARAAADTVLQAAITAITTAYLPLAGGTMLGKLYAQSNSDAAAQVRSIRLMTTVPAVGDLQEGEIAFVYVP